MLGAAVRHRAKYVPYGPPQPVEIVILRFGVLAPKPSYAGESMSPGRGIRWHPRKSSKNAHFLIS
jgi:hypothetical protein